MRCNICYLQIENHARDVKCPRCMNIFHQDHLAAWLLNEKSCPVCKAELSTSFREELRPKTKEDIRRVREASNELKQFMNTVSQWENRRSNKKRLNKIRRKHAGIEEEKIPMGKIIIPFLIFVVWVGLLFAVFS